MAGHCVLFWAKSAPKYKRNKLWKKEVQVIKLTRTYLLILFTFLNRQVKIIFPLTTFNYLPLHRKVMNIMIHSFKGVLFIFFWHMWRVDHIYVYTLCLLSIMWKPEHIISWVMFQKWTNAYIKWTNSYILYFSKLVPIYELFKIM